MTQFCSSVDPLSQLSNALPSRRRFWWGRSMVSAAMLLMVLLLCVALPAHAAGSNMPWEAPLQSVLESSR
jgi:hypothetical protein